MSIFDDFVVTATVPSDWTLESGRPIPIHHVSTRHAPLEKELRSGATLVVTEAGMAPAPTSRSGRTVPPRVLRARIEVGTTTGVSSRTSVHVNRSLALALQSGDVVSFRKDGSECFGLSVLRHGELAVACGAIIGLDVGPQVKLRSTWEELGEAEMIFRRMDDEFRLEEAPVAVSMQAQTRLIYSGRLEIGSYRVWADHGGLLGVPVRSECIAIWRTSVCPDTVAISSAVLLDQGRAISD